MDSDKVAYELRTANLIAYSDMLFKRGIYTTAGIGEKVDSEILKRLFKVKEGKIKVEGGESGESGK